MKTIKTSLFEIEKNTKRVFHIFSDCDENRNHIDIIGKGAGFSIAIENDEKKIFREFSNFPDLLLFVAKENLLKKRCHLRFF